jgi:hypothetical protein
MEMKLCGTMLCRNEDWIVGLSARAALMWLDYLIILDHASTDGTHNILVELQQEYPQKVQILWEANPEWREMEYRQRMLHEARMWGATHIAIVDADEVLSGNLINRIRPEIETIGPMHDFAPPWVGLRDSIHCYHTDGVWGNNWVSTAFLDNPNYYWRSREGYDFHHRRPMGMTMQYHRPWRQGEGGLMHLQFVSDRRLRAKQACYKMQEVLRWPGRKPVHEVDEMYNRAVYEKGRMAMVPEEWWQPYDKWMHHLKPDAMPWQETQCKLWWREYGRDTFQGLDLFGVI